MPTIDLVYFNAGGGHRSAALALEAVIREQGRPWAVRLVNLMQILDPQDVFRKTMGKSIRFMRTNLTRRMLCARNFTFTRERVSSL